VTVPAPAWQDSFREEKHFIGTLLREVLLFEIKLLWGLENTGQSWLEETCNTLPLCVGRRWTMKLKQKNLIIKKSPVPDGFTAQF
jgi:hypothetical protein